MIFSTAKKSQDANTIHSQVTLSLLSYLVLAQALVIVPHLFQLPLWLLPIWLGVVCWRWQIARGVWPHPTGIQKAFLVIACSAGLYFSFGAKPSFDAMMSLLILGFSLKLCELRSRKELLLLLYLALFILACFFIVQNSLSAVLYALIPFVFLFNLFMQLQKANVTRAFVWKDIRGIFFTVLQAIPLLLALFIVMPRLGSFWAVPSLQQAKTGLSDFLSPGDISELIESDALAFRVTFSGEIPAQQNLYWRSMALSFFDGRAWRQPSQHRTPLIFSTEKLVDSTVGPETAYEVIFEPTGQNWLVMLMVPNSWSDSLRIDSRFSVTSLDPINERLAYKLSSRIQARVTPLSENERAENLQLPAKGNPYTREEVARWLQIVDGPQAFIDKALGNFRESFYYTLQPKQLTSDAIDSFLRDTKQGYCEHFASSFVFMARAAGIPARVVTGYQGGEVHREAGYISVRQRHAHAWAEVWLENKGWTLVDPTAAVAPERILKSPEASLPTTDQARIQKPFYARIGIWAAATQYWDDVNYQWVRWVMNFDTENQDALLSKWFGDVSLIRLAGFILGAGALTLIMVYLFSFVGAKQKISKERFVLNLLTKKLNPFGLTPQIAESPMAFLSRVKVSFPDSVPELNGVSELYEKTFYAGQHQYLPMLIRQIKGLKLRKTKK